MQQIATYQDSRSALSGWRIYAWFPEAEATQLSVPLKPSAWAEVCSSARSLGFNAVCLPFENLAAVGDKAECLQTFRDSGLHFMVDVQLDSSDWRQTLRSVHSVLDESLPAGQHHAVLLRGFSSLSSEDYREILVGLRTRHEPLLLTVWAPGMSPEQLAWLDGLPVDGVCSSLAWWNYRDAWLVEEYERLRAVAPVIAPLADPRARHGERTDRQDVARQLAVASLAGEAVLVPAWQAQLLQKEGLADCIFHVGQMPPAGRGLRRLTGPLSTITVLFRSDDGSRMLLLNPHTQSSAKIDRALIERRLPNGYVLDQATQHDDAAFELEAGGWRFLPLIYADWIAKYGTSSRQQRGTLAKAVRSPRIAIESVRPVVDSGRFAVKRILGESVSIRAVVFMDGHEELAVELLWRPLDETQWQHTPMLLLGNDEWEARITPHKLGRYVYTVRAWWAVWKSYRVQLEKKVQAGTDVSLDVEEGRRLLQLCRERADDLDREARATIDAAIERVGAPMEEAPARKLRPRAGGARPPSQETHELLHIPPATPSQVEAVLDPALDEAISRVEDHAFETEDPVHYPLSIDRNEAMFSSWYELFPRSQSPEPGRHGTFRDVIAKLPDIRRMGFDVLYFPPIHPIGERNRKGRNNALRAEPDDPGSPYAIGSEHGGHDAVHPELGTFADFRDLLSAAQQHGLEIALDFAIQCSPDHPWLREHPDWFNWRPDGSLKYAENPPKRYEDIVNPDFYSPLASTPRQAALWRALRDIVIFWIQQGVRIFRVDNPHTKPLPFWEWMLREVRDRHPDTIFLSEAFTRPAMMYRLAKLGFSQSYTYFTWRNSKQELTDYMLELNREPVRDFFRPNFFVNTPDINPWFLQTSGRAGFLIRAVLAGTLSGSWGVYNGFELCVAEPVPGKEEYLDSEKYQLRRWDTSAPGNIVDEITRLNRIRRSHPALQSHLGIQFHRVDNDRVIFYSRHSAEGDSVVLVAVSLDPHHAQHAHLELPLEQWGEAQGATLAMRDLFEDRPFELRGRWQHIELTPARPFVLWARVPADGGMT